MAIDRRSFLAALAATLGLPSTTAARETTVRFLSAQGTLDGDFAVAGLDAAGEMLFQLPLPDRGHAVALRPASDEAVVFARRPGSFAVVFDAVDGAPVMELEAGADRHFFGHGVFSADGRHLLSTENDIASGLGVLGIRDAADGYKRVREFPTYGTGPHDLSWLADGTTLVVANGGILTTPETGRAKLNRATMVPSLAYIDGRDGRLLREFRLAPELNQLSIRHLARAADDTVAIGMQFDGDASALVPLVGVHRGDEEIRLLSAPENALRKMDNYCGDICIDCSGRTIAASSPRGNTIGFWDVDDGGFLGTVDLTDACGLAPLPDPDRFLITSGTGALYLVDGRRIRVETLVGDIDADGHWDNHVTLLA
jgi:uncharacterized protein